MASVKELERIAHEIRIDILKMYYRAGWGHMTPALSCVEIFTALYFGGVMRMERRFEHDHDWVIMSKGHGCATWYSCLSRTGYFPHEDLNGFYQAGSKLVGLASSGVNGVPLPTGSLGHGICFATGTALAAKCKENAARTYVLLGDGESQEGSVWEAAMFAGAHGLDNLCVILDRNGLQASDRVENITQDTPIRERWEAFGWRVEECEGHDFPALLRSFSAAKEYAGRPSLIIAHTTKGKGISFAEAKEDWHSRAPRGEEWARACEELGIRVEELERI